MEVEKLMWVKSQKDSDAKYKSKPFKYLHIYYTIDYIDRDRLCYSIYGQYPQTRTKPSYSFTAWYDGVSSSEHHTGEEFKTAREAKIAAQEHFRKTILSVANKGVH